MLRNIVYIVCNFAPSYFIYKNVYQYSVSLSVAGIHQAYSSSHSASLQDLRISGRLI